MSKDNKRNYILNFENKIEKMNKRFLRNFYSTLVFPGEEEVHNLRISIRELNEGAEISSAILNKKLPNFLIKLKGLLKVLGKLRDLHVENKIIIEKFGEKFNLESEIAETQSEIKNLLNGFDIDLLEIDIKKLHNEIEKILKKLDIKKVEKRIKSYLSKKYSNLIKKTSLSDFNKIEELHRIRVAYKKFRYSAEALKDYLCLTKADLKRLKKIQDILGEINDLQNITVNIEDLKKKKNYRITHEKMNAIIIEKYEKIEIFHYVLESEKIYWKHLISRC